MKPRGFIGLLLAAFPLIFNGVSANAASTQFVGDWVCHTVSTAPSDRPFSTSTLMIHENGQMNWILTIKLDDVRGKINAQLRMFARWVVSDNQLSLDPSFLLLKRLEIDGENKLDTDDAQRLEARLLDRNVHVYQVEKTDPNKLVFFNHQRRVACIREAEYPLS